MFKRAHRLINQSLTMCNLASSRTLMMVVIVMATVPGSMCDDDSYLTDDSEYPAVDSPHCQQMYTCLTGDGNMTSLASTRNNSAWQEKGCFCDNKCSLYGDCCHDRSPSTTNPWTERHMDLPNVTSCQGYHYFQDMPEVPYDVYVVDRCPVSYHDPDIRAQCELTSSDVLLQIPVSDKHGGFLFKNLHCALCNGWTADEVLFWVAKLNCTMLESPRDETSVTDYQQYSATELVQQAAWCQFEFFAPSGVASPRECIEAKSACHERWSDEETATSCREDDVAYVYYAHDVYKNQHCAMCNYLAADAVTCKAPKMDLTVWEPARFLGGMKAVPITILLDYNRGGSSVEGDKHTPDVVCQEDYVLDVASELCRPIDCEVGEILQGDICIDLSKSDHNALLATCPKLVLPSSNFQQLTNGSIYDPNTDKTYDSDEYILNNDTIYICAESWGGIYEFDVAQGMLSFCCQIISLSALTLLLLVYGSFKALRTLPGKCLMSLSGALYAAQFFFIVGMFSTEVRGWCVVVAVLVHFCFLLAFSWMNVLSFDVWQTFHQHFSFSGSAGHQKRKYRIFNAYTLIIPTCFILIGIILDAVDNPNTSRPLYGHQFCWINDSRALLYLFILPVFIIIITNYVFFIMSVYHIYHASHSADILRKPKGNANRKRLLLYLKLSTIMGLTWLFGILGSITGSSVLWYLFVIFNSLQGLFISVAFLCNRKVYRLLADEYIRVSSRITSASASFRSKHTRQTQLSSGHSSSSASKHSSSSSSRTKTTSAPL